jgi:hypothetical protein
VAALELSLSLLSVVVGTGATAALVSLLAVAVTEIFDAEESMEGKPEDVDTAS